MHVGDSEMDRACSRQTGSVCRRSSICRRLRDGLAEPVVDKRLVSVGDLVYVGDSETDRACSKQTVCRRSSVCRKSSVCRRLRDRQSLQ